MVMAEVPSVSMIERRRVEQALLADRRAESLPLGRRGDRSPGPRIAPRPHAAEAIGARSSGPEGSRAARRVDRSTAPNAPREVPRRTQRGHTGGVRRAPGVRFVLRGIALGGALLMVGCGATCESPGRPHHHGPARASSRSNPAAGATGGAARPAPGRVGRARHPHVDHDLARPPARPRACSPRLPPAGRAPCPSPRPRPTWSAPAWPTRPARSSMRQWHFTTAAPTDGVPGHC